MIRVNRVIFLLLLLSWPIFPQNKIDTALALKDVREEKLHIISNPWHESSNKTQLFSKDFSVPLNLKIYQKLILSDYITPYKFTREELSTGMSDNELIAFERNRLKTRKMLSELYGEDFIDIEKLLDAFGITKEQLISVAAILKLFLM